MLDIRPALGAIYVEGLSAPPCLSAGLLQPLQCVEDMITLSESLHYPAHSGRACCPQISPPLLSLSTSPLSCHPFSQPLHIQRLDLQLSVANAICIWKCDVVFRPCPRSLITLCRQNERSSSIDAFTALILEVSLM